MWIFLTTKNTTLKLYDPQKLFPSLKNKVVLLYVLTSEALNKVEGTKKIKTTLFHQYSSNSEVETTWIRLICWPHKTSVCPLQHTNFSGKSTSWWQDVPNWGDSTLQQCCLHWLTEWTPVDFRRFLFLPSFQEKIFTQS